MFKFNNFDKPFSRRLSSRMGLVALRLFVCTQLCASTSIGAPWTNIFDPNGPNYQAFSRLTESFSEKLGDGNWGVIGGQGTPFFDESVADRHAAAANQILRDNPNINCLYFTGCDLGKDFNGESNSQRIVDSLPAGTYVFNNGQNAPNLNSSDPRLRIVDGSTGIPLSQDDWLKVLVKDDNGVISEKFLDPDGPEARMLLTPGQREKYRRTLARKNAAKPGTKPNRANAHFSENNSGSDVCTVNNKAKPGSVPNIRNLNIHSPANTPGALKRAVAHSLIDGIGPDDLAAIGAVVGGRSADHIGVNSDVGALVGGGVFGSAGAYGILVGQGMAAGLTFGEANLAIAAGATNLAAAGGAVATSSAAVVGGAAALAVAGVGFAGYGIANAGNSNANGNYESSYFGSFESIYGGLKFWGE